MSALAAAESAPPSAELLLYLAEFADADGNPEDPVAVERELEADEDTNDSTESNAESDDDEPEPAKPDAAR